MKLVADRYLLPIICFIDEEKLMDRLSHTEESVVLGLSIKKST